MDRVQSEPPSGGIPPVARVTAEEEQALDSIVDDVLVPLTQRVVPEGPPAGYTPPPEAPARDGQHRDTFFVLGGEGGARVARIDGEGPRGRLYATDKAVEPPVGTSFEDAAEAERVGAAEADADQDSTTARQDTAAPSLLAPINGRVVDKKPPSMEAPPSQSSGRSWNAWVARGRMTDAEAHSKPPPGSAPTPRQAESSRSKAEEEEAAAARRRQEAVERDAAYRAQMAAQEAPPAEASPPRVEPPLLDPAPVAEAVKEVVEKMVKETVKEAVKEAVKDTATAMQPAPPNAARAVEETGPSGAPSDARPPQAGPAGRMQAPALTDHDERQPRPAFAGRGRWASMRGDMQRDKAVQQERAVQQQHERAQPPVPQPSPAVANVRCTGNHNCWPSLLLCVDLPETGTRISCRSGSNPHTTRCRAAVVAPRSF